MVHSRDSNLCGEVGAPTSTNMTETIGETKYFNISGNWVFLKNPAM